MKQVLVDLRPELMAQRNFHSIDRTVKDRADRTRQIDVTALDLYTLDLKNRLPGTPALVCSEENPGGTTLTNSPGLPDLLFIIDPIDNTDGAIHGSPCYTALSVYLRSRKTVIAAAVGDFFQHEIYYADESLEGAVKYSLSDETWSPIEMRPSRCTTLAGAYISIYTLKPGRLLSVTNAKTLIRELGEEGRVDCIGGAAALCKVAAGYIDAALEFAKGFQTYDLFPGAYILMKAGGQCYRPDGDSVSLTLNFDVQDQLPAVMKTRQRFIATGTQPLFIKILRSLSQDGLLDADAERANGGRA